MAMSKVAKTGEGEMAEDYYYYQHQHSRHRDISSPEVSSSYAAARKDAAEVEEGGEREEELELGLSLGATKAGKGAGVATASTGPWREYCRILTAKDFPSMVSSRVVSPNSSSSASSSFPMGGSGGDAAGTKRGSDSVAHEVGSNTPSHVVGWPPIRAYRINNLFNQSKDNASENNHNVHEKKSISQTANTHHKSIKNSSIQENAGFKDHEKKGRSLFVKVNMDGMAIGRKVDLSSHQSYDTLALALEDMFEKPSSLRTSFKSTKASTSKLLDGSSEFVLTYEDKDGDWMLVGDVPWGMFLSTVRRLRIMRTTDANGLAPRIQSSIMDVFRSKPV